MPLAYLSAEAARSRLIAIGLYTEATAPSLELLTLHLEPIERAIDAWMGFRAAPETYTENVSSGPFSPLALIQHYPLIEVLAIAQVPGFFTAYLPPVEQIITGQLRAVNLFNVNSVVRLTYRAGYDPIPGAFGDAVFAILAQALRSRLIPGDLAFFQSPAMVGDVEEIQLPSGLRKRFSTRTTGAIASQSALDRIMAPLADLRRKIFTSGEGLV